MDLKKEEGQENQSPIEGEVIVRKTLEEKLADRKEARANRKKPGRKPKRGRPKGGKDKKKRLIRNPRRQEIEKLFPEGAKTKMIQFEQIVLSSENIEKTYQKLNDIIQDNTHKDQWNAMKFVLERVAHISHFEKASGGSKPQITINVSGSAEISGSEE